jgi:RND family efflux transporter MFP subunit
MHEMEVTRETPVEREQQQKLAPRKSSRLFVLLAVVVVALVLMGGFTLLQRRTQYAALAQETERMAVPTVSVFHPALESSQEDLVLPGTLQAYVESPIYARTSGYVKRWYHDIGSRVKEGDLLADIDTPEVDQQLAQARSDLNTAEANANLSRITANRYTELIKTDGVSKQEVDNATGDYAAKEATVASAQANVRRLEQLESFKHIYAPFSGVITRRNVDIGNLINAGNGGASQQLFYLAQTDPMRVYVNVPEMYAPAAKAGLQAYLELTQYPGRRFEGKVVRTADAIDPGTRTLLTEVDVPNRAGELLPGGYAQVHLAVKVTGARLQVPVNALLFRAEGLRAVKIDASHCAHLQALTIGRDYGTSLEVLQGLSAEDWIVLNPPDSIEEGDQVQVRETMGKTEEAGVPGGGRKAGATAQHGAMPQPGSGGKSVK